MLGSIGSRNRRLTIGLRSGDVLYSFITLEYRDPEIFFPCTYIAALGIVLQGAFKNDHTTYRPLRQYCGTHQLHRHNVPGTSTSTCTTVQSTLSRKY
jgi:hypothetical protein